MNGDRQATAAYLMWQRNPPPGGWTDNRLAQAQHYRGAVYLALSAVTEALASARVWLERRVARKAAVDGAGDDEHYVPTRDHPLADIIARPNPHESLPSVLAYMALQWGLTGNAPVWCVPNRRGQPVELYPLPEALLQPLSPTPAYPRGAWRVTPYYPSGWAATAGTYQSVAGAVIPGDELVRMKAPHPLFSWDGYSPLTACGVQLDILEAIDRSRHAAFLHGTQFGYIVTVPDATPETLAQVKARLLEEHAGPDRAHGVVVVSTQSATGSKVSVEPVGTTPREMDYIQSWEQAVKWVLAVYGVPASITGIQSSTSYAEFYAAQVQFHYRIAQLARRLADFLTRHVAGPWSEFPGELRLKVEVPPPRNRDELRQQLANLGGQGVATVNEIRAAYDLAPWPGGDVPPPIYLQRLQQPSPPPPAPPAEGAPPAEATSPGAEAPPAPATPEGDDSRPPVGAPVDAVEKSAGPKHEIGEVFEGSDGQQYIMVAIGNGRVHPVRYNPDDPKHQKLASRAHKRTQPRPVVVARVAFDEPDPVRHQRVTQNLPDHWEAVSQVVADYRRLHAANEIQRVNDVMVQQFRSWNEHQLLDLMVHYAAAARSKNGERFGRLGKSVAGWAQKANEIFLIQRLFGGELATGQQQGIDGVIPLPNGTRVDINAKLVTKYSLQDNFKKEDIARLHELRQSRGDRPKAPPPFGRLALVLHPHPPHSAKNGVYFMPDYSQGVYGSTAENPVLQPVRLADITELETALASGKLTAFRKRLRQRLQTRVDWKGLQKHMVQSEADHTLSNMRALGASIKAQKALAGKKAALKAAQEGVASLEQTEEGKQAILASKTHQQALQEKDQALQEKDQALQHFKRLGPLWAKDAQAAETIQRLIEAGKYDEAHTLLTQHGL